MTQDTDAILDSIRQEASAGAPERIPEKAQVLPVAVPDPQQHTKTTAYDEDDDMSEEMERLEEITMAIRNSLHEEDTIPIVEVNTSVKRDKETAPSTNTLPPVSRKEEAKPSSTAGTSSVPLKDHSKSPKKQRKPAAAAKKEPTASTPKKEMKPAAASTTKSAKKNKHGAVTKERPIDTKHKTSTALVVSCVLIWTAVIVLFIRARYLLDTQGFIRSPLTFAR